MPRRTKLGEQAVRRSAKAIAIGARAATPLLTNLRPRSRLGEKQKALQPRIPRTLSRNRGGASGELMDVETVVAESSRKPLALLNERVRVR